MFFYALFCDVFFVEQKLAVLGWGGKTTGKKDFFHHLIFGLCEHLELRVGFVEHKRVLVPEHVGDCLRSDAMSAKTRVDDDVVEIECIAGFFNSEHQGDCRLRTNISQTLSELSVFHLFEAFIYATCGCCPILFFHAKTVPVTF